MKRACGRQWFYSMGQRSMYSNYLGPVPTTDWPVWARRAFFIGQDDERFSRARAEVKRWDSGKLITEARLS